MSKLLEQLTSTELQCMQYQVKQVFSVAICTTGYAVSYLRLVLPFILSLAVTES